MERYEGLRDEALLERMRQGEKGISDYLMEKYKFLVRKKARAMFLVGGETDDLIQEGMIGLFKAIRDFRPDREASFQTFARMCIDRQLYSAVQNSMRMKHQPLNGYISLNDENEEKEFREQMSENPESIMIERESEDFLRQKIYQGLSKMEAEVLTAYLEGDSYEKIAARIGKSTKSVDNALRRIREKIREGL